MKVHIERAQTKSGMITKKHVHKLTLSIEATPEEAEAARIAGVNAMTLLNGHVKEEPFEFKAYMFMHDDGRPRTCSVEMDHLPMVIGYEEEFLENVQTFKKIIDLQLARPEHSEETIEL